MKFQIYDCCVYKINIISVELYRSMSEQELSQSQQPEIAGFVAKTFEILSNQEYSKIIFWGSNGKEFVIKDINKFQQIVLPKFFRHRKINSFIRQLNMYGFHKSRKDNAKSIFSHPNFLKDRQDLLPTIKRKIKCFQSTTKTPQKQKCNNLQNKQPETAVKEQESLKKPQQEPSLIVLKGFFESKEYIGSGFNLNISLNKISMNDIQNQKFQNDQDNDDDKLSIELQIQKNQLRQMPPKILNPSFFFSSFRQYQKQK